mmetsp:Transcript_371/g.1251  ORF Transcript_371/g.1251 Transcript_371/m.1251 type:complete len:281 (-) Transcript_371:179-1021(-)
MSDYVLHLDAYQHLLLFLRISLDESEVLRSIEARTERNCIEDAEGRWESRGIHSEPVDVPFIPLAILDEVCNGSHNKSVFGGKFLEVRASRHRSVTMVNNFDKNTNWRAPRQSREVQSSFSVTFPLEDTILVILEGENMARTVKILRTGEWVGKGLKRQRTICSRDTSRRPVLVVARHCKCCLLRVGVVGHHRSKLQTVSRFRCDRSAYDTARVTDHECDILGRNLICRHDQISLVFPARVIGDHDHPSTRNCCDRLLNALLSKAPAVLICLRLRRQILL